MDAHQKESSGTNAGHAARLAARTKALTGQTSGRAPSHLQANLIVLPRRYRDDFRLLCARNPVPCPLLAESASPGDATFLRSHLKVTRSCHQINHSGSKSQSEHLTETVLQVAQDIDLRMDAPKYRIYQDGKLVDEEATDIVGEWTEDHVGFLIGCSFSFETALAEAGLPPRHMVHQRNVPMYRTQIPLCPAGVFVGGTYVVSMRPYKRGDVHKVRDITRRYVATHGEPIAWGWDAVTQLGIEDIKSPEWGNTCLTEDGTRLFDDTEENFVPVFWGCGITPQNAVMMANLDGTVMAHGPGHMIILDVRDEELLGD